MATKPKAGAKAPAAAQERVDPMRSGVDVAALSGTALRSYATQIGVPARDVEHLTDDRLRQNCQLHFDHLYALAED